VEKDILGLRGLGDLPEGQHKGLFSGCIQTADGNAEVMHRSADGW